MSENGFNREALHGLYEELHGPMFNFALRWVFNESQAEELVHESFIRIWKIRDEVQGETVKSLLFKTLQNLCFSHLRKEKVWQTVKQLDPLSMLVSESFENQVNESQEIQTMRQQMEKIPTQYRKVLLLFYFGEFSYDEIANILQISQGTVASRKSRALEMLKTHFKQELEYAF